MLAVAGGKGGCGKTTTALGLGAALPGETTVVDADRDMPNLHALAGVDREPSAAVGAAPQRVDDGLSVLPAPTPETDDAGVARLLDDVAGRTAGRILVDCPGGAGPDAAAPLSAASEALLVSTPCGPALRDATKTAAMARALGCRVVGCVLTRTDAAPSGVESLFDCPVLGTVPDADDPVLADERARAAFDRVAAALDGRAEEPVVAGRSG
jgi:septum site-determining protein MinD